MSALPQRHIIPFRDPSTAPAPSDLFLREAFSRFLRPDMEDSAAATVADYESTIRIWEQLSGNPPVGQIDDQVLHGFKMRLQQRTWRGKPVSKSTIKKHLGNLRAILRRCGPPGYRNPQGQSIIERVPYVKPPTVKKKDRTRITRVVPIGDVDTFYRACRVARWPAGRLTPAPLMWRVILAMLWQYGMRIEDLLTLTFAANIVDAPECPHAEIVCENPHGWLTFTTTKTDVDIVLPISHVVRRHLDAIKGNGDRLFPVPYRKSSWMDERRRIQSMFATPYTFQELRKTCNVNWKRIDREFGPIVLGHTPGDVNSTFYSNALLDIRDGLSKFPIPPAMLQEI